MNAQTFLSFDIRGMLTGIVESLSVLSARLGLKPFVLLIAASVLALLVGVAGMHLAKVLASTGCAIVGYFSGVILMKWISTFEIFSKLPAFLSYVIGAVVAVLLFFFGWKRCLHAIFIVFFVVGCALVKTFVPVDSVMLCLCGGLIVSMLSTFMVKIAFSALTSFLGGFAILCFLGEMLPKVKYLQLMEANRVAIWLAVGVSVVFFIFQLITTRKYALVKD